jgi:DNA-binding response OmpR family regulator
MRELLRVHLHNAGYSVMLAPDAIVAGRTILQNPNEMDALIVDAKLPYMGGVDFVSTLIADSSLPFIPTVLIAATDELLRSVEVLDVPVLTPPFSPQQLLDLVDQTIHKQQIKSSPSDAPARSVKQRLEDLASSDVKQQSRKRPLRIVIADDEHDTVTSLMAILCHEGHSVFGSHHGHDVMREVRLNKPDAVILDIDMPGTSGYAIAREIRDMFPISCPLLIAVSGKWVGEPDQMLAKFSVFQHFLLKPCNPPRGHCWC